MKHNYLKQLFTAFLLLCATVATAHDFEVGGIYYNILSEEEKTVEVTFKGSRYNEYSNEYTGCVLIPESVTNNGRTYSVTSFGEYTFRDCFGLTSVEIPNSVTTIGGYAFFDCSGLTSVEIPNSVTSIVNHMFYNCSGLTSIEIPNSVTSIGDAAFYNCSSLASVVIPNSITSIGNAAFSGCSGLTSVVIGNSVTTIGSSAFSGCTGLTSVHISDLAAWCNINFGSQNANPLYYVKSLYLNNELVTELVIPDNITEINMYAFYNCYSLASIEISNSVTSIGTDAFYGTAWYDNQPDGVVYAGKVLYKYKGTMPANTSIVVKEGTLGIAGKAFSSCHGLTSIEISNSVTSIGAGAFEYCSGLTNVVIGNSVTSIGSGAFYNCSGLASVTIPNSVTTIGSDAFYGCSGLTSIVIPNSVTSIGSGAFKYCSGLTNVVIGNSVTSIGGNAFYNCSGLTSVVIGNSVTSIGDYAFRGCSRLKTVYNLSKLTFYRGSSSYGYVAGYVVYDGDKLINAPNGFIDGDFVFYRPNGVNTMVGCLGNATALTLPADCEGETYVIGENTFKYCTGLTSIEIPNSVTSIGSGAFYNCTGLTSVVIGNSVTSIGDAAFYNCSGLTSITSLIPAEDLFAITSYVFESVNKNACTLYVPYGTKETYTSTAGWSEFVNVVEIMPTEVNISINQYGAGTYCSSFALDFSEVEGLKAYSAIGYKPSTQTVTLARVMTTGAGQGIFIKGEPGEYKIPIIDDFDEYTLNMLVGTLGQTTVNSTDGEMSNYRFTIAEGDDAPMFYPFADNTTFSANRAYLQIPTAWLPATAQKSLNVRFDDGETTDIEELEGEPTVDASQNGEVKTVYDLQGRVVENPAGGIYIVNGKKVIIK